MALDGALVLNWRYDENDGTRIAVAEQKDKDDDVYGIGFDYELSNTDCARGAAECQCVTSDGNKAAEANRINIHCSAQGTDHGSEWSSTFTSFVYRIYISDEEPINKEYYEYADNIYSLSQENKKLRAQIEGQEARLAKLEINENDMSRVDMQISTLETQLEASYQKIQALQQKIAEQDETNKLLQESDENLRR